MHLDDVIAGITSSFSSSSGLNFSLSLSALDHYACRVAAMKRISSPGVPWRSSRIFPACTTSTSTSTSTTNLRRASFIERGHIKLNENEGLLFINSKGCLLISTQSGADEFKISFRPSYNGC